MLQMGQPDAVQAQACIPARTHTRGGGEEQEQSWHKLSQMQVLSRALCLCNTLRFCITQRRCSDHLRHPHVYSRLSRTSSLMQFFSLTPVCHSLHLPRSSCANLIPFPFQHHRQQQRLPIHSRGRQRFLDQSRPQSGITARQPGTHTLPARIANRPECLDFSLCFDSLDGVPAEPHPM